MTDLTSPSHYQQGDIKRIQEIKSSMPVDVYRSYLAGNAIQYMWRYRYKGGLEDLEKAKIFLESLITSVKG